MRETIIVDRKKSLNSLIIAFIGLFPICLYADIADSSSSKYYNTRILYFNVSLWQRAIECSLAAVKLAVKSAWWPIFSPHRCKMYWHENQKVKFLYPYTKINNYFDSINNQAPLLDKIAWTLRSEVSHREMACTGWTQMEEAMSMHSWPTATWHHTMGDGPCVTPPMNISNPGPRSYTTPQFLMEPSPTGAIVTTFQLVRFLLV